MEKRFTGAIGAPGRSLRARGRWHTVADEIGDLDGSLQTKLCAFARWTFERVGGKNG